MSDPKGFIKYNRELPTARHPSERIQDYKEIYETFSLPKVEQQAARCMDCGIPFCHSGCPLGNLIPDFNEAVYEGDWEQAYKILISTNNFPEFTGRICPAPCEASCVLGINQSPVAIEMLEKEIIEKAYDLNLVSARVPKTRSGKKVAVVGSGPAGLAAADQLNMAGHSVTVFERDDRVGGLLRYGIPDFKLEKRVLDRRIELMEQSGITFKINSNIGVNIEVQYLMDHFDAIVLCGGSTIPRDLKVPGRELKGVHFAMDFLMQNNRRVSGDFIKETDAILATDKHVLVIGGGDTGADCVGTSNRHNAKSVTQIEILGKPPLSRSPDTPWPLWPMMLRSSSSHDEGCNREWAILTKEFIGDKDGKLKGIKIVDVEWVYVEEGRSKLAELPGTERLLSCELVLLAVGFVHPQHEGMIHQLGVEINERGNVSDNEYQTNLEKIFVAGDMRRGQSLVVWAIAEGREAAAKVNKYLKV